MISITKDKDKVQIAENTEMVELIVTGEDLKNLEDHLQRFAKNSYAKTVSSPLNSPIEVSRRSMLVDYPFMAKL